MNEARRERRRTFFEKVVDVQAEYQRHKIHDGVTDSWIWRHHIHRRFYIGYRTMKNYLEIPARRELKSLENLAESCAPSASPIS